MGRVSTWRLGGGRAPLILNFGDRWGGCQLDATGALSPWKNPSRPQGLSGRVGEKKNLFPLPGFEIQTVQPVASRYID